MSELQGIYLNTNKPLRNKFGVREKTLLSIALFVFLLGSIMIMGSLISADDISINLTNKNLEPSLNHLFGTDWVGRDMFYRTITAGIFDVNKNVPWHILAPSAVVCDKLPHRASAHRWQVVPFCVLGSSNGIS